MDVCHILGAGGIGCAVGYFLARAGCSVTFIDANPEKVHNGQVEGVAVDDLPPQPAAFLRFADWQPDPAALTLLCTKCYDNAAVLARVPDSVHLVPIQNGFDPALEARPAHLEGIASFVSECLPDRPHTRITRGGDLHLGINRAARGGEEATLRQIATRLAQHLRRASFPVVVVEDIRPFKYTKLMYNAAISPLASMAGLDNGEVLRQPRVRALFFGLLRENLAILERAGIPLGRIGPFHPATVGRILRMPWLARLLSLFFCRSLRGTYCSMFHDLPAGRTEIEFYNRRLLDLADGRTCPLNALVYEWVERLERERLPVGWEALERVLRAFEAGPESPVGSTRFSDLVG
jgi:2-dehydropantoate 2-reductase